eukprot:TRINITY_DN35996_c0_g1_i2.p1 TRINITY_DN35996_c0_g1~~TRINITY_DN35996_c0_g1_i2.p1  ORF type:complete len:284 (+),score=39.77 TRINITY_DN35996_c0_g1_i2:42-854(+)
MPARYDILSIRNPVVKELFHLRRRRNVRSREGAALVRGRRLIQHIGENFRFKRIYTHEDPAKWSGYSAEKVVSTHRSVLEHVFFGPSRREHMSRLDDDEFVAGVIDMPQPVEDFEGRPRWILALDGVKYPENMGLLLSTAVALRFDGVVLSEDCVDPFNYKVLEASQGVAWPLPYRWGNPAEILDVCKRHNLELCAADAKGTPVTQLPVRSTDERGICLAIGSEKRGVSSELLGTGCRQISLPMSELVESLNAGVAGGILMHALASAWGR